MRPLACSSDKSLRSMASKLIAAILCYFPNPFDASCIIIL
jgi:hypothetical protein